MARDVTSTAEDKEKNPVGRPLKYKTVAELNLAIQTYFDECDPHWVYDWDWVEKRKPDGSWLKDKNGQNTHVRLKVRRKTEQVPYTMAGLAAALGISRQTLLDYSEREEFLDSIAAAKVRCEEYAESQLFGPYANGAKFNLINNYRGKYQPWADKQEITGANDAPLMPIGLDAAVLARRTSKTDGSTPPSTTADSDQQS